MQIIQVVRNNFAHLLSLIQKNVFLILLILGFIIYGNGLINDFVLDDLGQVVGNPLIRSVQNIPGLFTGSTFSDGALMLRGNYYRPIMTSVYTVLYSFFGPQPFSFHLIQLLLHVANAWLVYKIFRRWFAKSLALFGSLIFLVHPINSETVLYIANLQDTLFMFFGLIAFYVFIAKPFRSYNALIIFISLLFSLLSKETGILFICLLLLYQLLYEKTHLLKTFFIVTFAVVIYFFLKYAVAHIGFLANEPFAPISLLPFNERVIFIPSIITFYLKTFFFPLHLLTVQNWQISFLNIANFYHPLLLSFVIFIFLAFLPLTLFKNEKTKKKQYIFFVLWFTIGLSLHLQIFPLDATVADHWFYFPIIGLTAIILMIIKEVFLRRKLYLHLAVLLGIIVLLLLSIRSFARSFDFRNEYALAVHDLSQEPDNFVLQNILGIQLQKRGDLAEAEKHYLIASKIFPENNMAWNNLGFLYEQKGAKNNNNIQEYNKADAYYMKAIQTGNSPTSYVNLAELRLFKEQYEYLPINAFIESSLKKFPNNPNLLLMHAITLYELQRKEMALKEIQHALQIQPENIQFQQVFQWITANATINLTP
jgi:protein O-mannosyl-transferase